MPVAIVLATSPMTKLMAAIPSPCQPSRRSVGSLTVRSYEAMDTGDSDA
jgi:hypothetical protein